MIYASFISIPILIMIFSAIFFLGRHISQAYEVFNETFFGPWIIGFITYFGITFLAFFPFLWIKLNVLYYVVIFFVKEGFLFLVLILKRNYPIKMYELLSLSYIMGASIIIVVVYNFGIRYIINTQDIKNTEQFQTWNLFGRVIASFSKVSITFVNKWVLSMIIATLIYSVVSLFFETFTFNFAWVDKIISFFVSFALIICLSFNRTLYQNGPLYLTLFTLILSMRILYFSRRRYGALFGLSIIVIYSFDSHFTFVVFLNAIISMIIYTFLKKPKVSLFWVQVIAPIAVVEGLSFYSYSKGLAFFLFSIAAITYLFMIALKRNAFLEKLNKVFEKLRIIFPIILWLSIFIVAISYAFMYKTNWSELAVIKQPIINSWNKEYLLYIQWIIFTISVSLLIFNVFYFYIKKVKMTIHRILISFILLVVLFIYNPIINSLIERTPLSNQFEFINIIVFAPLFIISVNFIKEKIKIKGVWKRNKIGV